MIQSGDQVALSWRLSRPIEHDPTQRIDAPPTMEQQEAKGVTPWGPGNPWQPVAFIIQQREEVAAPSAELDAASAEELGPYWAPFGADWCWAHTGTKQNGWFRLASNGVLESRWGAG